MQTQEDAAQIRRAAVMGLGILADSAVLPILQRTTAAYAVEGSFKPDTEIETIEREHFDYQHDHRSDKGPPVRLQLECHGFAGGKKLVGVRHVRIVA